MKIPIRFIACAFSLLALPSPAQAYVDLGLGGQLFQTVYLIGVGVLAVIATPVLYFWRHIRRLFHRPSRTTPPQSGTAPTGQPILHRDAGTNGV